MLCALQAVTTREESFPHQPVLSEEVLASLALRPDGCYIDATFGRGGHSRQILQQLSGEGRLFALDRDPAAAAEAAPLQRQDSRFRFVQAPFSRLLEVAEDHDLDGVVDGVLLDLGVSSPQLDDAARGFSFGRDGPLDMRMDPEKGISAARWLAGAQHGEIAQVLRRYGEEPMAGRIAAAICRARELEPITRTAQLAEIVAGAVPAKVTAGKRIHPATRSFQAIRIHINRELEELEAVLPQTVDVLAPGGRVVIISFHSLEDRLVKRFLRREAQPPLPEVPMAPMPVPRLALIGAAQTPTEAELERNPRARSAVLRVAERTAEGRDV